MHSFPSVDKQPSLAQAWLDAIQRDNSRWKPSLSTSVCSLHFKPEDFVTFSTTKCSRHNRGSLKRRRLKEDAIPTIGLGSPSDRATQTKGQPFLGFTRNEELAMFTQDDDPLETEDDHQNIDDHQDDENETPPIIEESDLSSQSELKSLPNASRPKPIAVCSRTHEELRNENNSQDQHESIELDNNEEPQMVEDHLDPPNEMGKCWKDIPNVKPIESSGELYKILSEIAIKLPDDFHLLKRPKVSLVKMLTSEAKGLRVEASVEINHDLTYKVFYKNKEVAVPAAPDKIRYLGDACRIIEAFLKTINS